MDLSPHRGLIAWQLANQYKKAVYALVRRPPAALDRAFAEHLRRTAVSIELNIVEGAHRPGARDFARFLAIARGSLAEAEAQIDDGLDRGHFIAADLTAVRALARRAGAAIDGLRRAVLRRAGGN